MALAKITLLGMYEYLNSEGIDLFSEMTLPAEIDKDILVDSIMLRGAEFEILYSEPQTMRNAIGAWSRKWQHTLTKWAKVLAIEYDPLENYDRRESWSDAKIGNESRKGSRKESGSSSDMAVANGNGTNENQRAAYDSASYSPVEKDINSSQNASSGASVRNASGTDSEDRSNAESSLHEGRTHGNIGVTTSQQMLQSEWDVAKLNVYEEAAELFLTELTIYTY